MCLNSKHSHVLKNLLTLLMRSTLAVALSDGMVLTKFFQFSKAPSLSPLATFLGGEAALPVGKGCPCPVEEGAEKAGAPISCKAYQKASQHRSVCYLESGLLQPHLTCRCLYEAPPFVCTIIQNGTYNRARWSKA